MRVLVLMEVDEDTVLDMHGQEDASIEGAVEGELGWVSQSGMSVIEVITPDGTNPNDAELGREIRNILNR